MLVKELIELLKKFPQELTVITTCCSDFEKVEEVDITVTKAVDKGFYIMQSHHSMSEENKLNEREFLHIRGGV